MKRQGNLSALIGGLLFPQGTYCICCGKYIDESRTYSLCDHCIRRMNFEPQVLELADDGVKDRAPSVIDCAMTAMGYGIYERRLIFSLKYDGKTYIAPVAADILHDCLIKALRERRENRWLSADLIVPVPISAERMKERGFNQAEKIARHLGRKSGIRVGKDVLLRCRDTQAQRALSATERRENMKGAFITNPQRSEVVKGKKILLLDDIYTTGATAWECAKALKIAGASEIYFLALLGATQKDHEFST